MKSFWLSLMAFYCVVAFSLAAKKSSQAPSSSSSVKSVKREIPSSYHGPSHKYLPPSPGVVASSYNNYNRGLAAGFGSYHGSKGNGGIFNIRGAHSHGHGSFAASVPKVETYLVQMEHSAGGGGGASGLGSGYKYTVGPSYSTAGASTHSTAGHFAGGGYHIGSGNGGSHGSGSGYKVHSVVIPLHGSGGDGDYHSGHHDFSVGASDGTGYSGHSAGGNSYSGGYHYNSAGSGSVGSVGSDYDYDHYDHSIGAGIGHSIGSTNNAGGHSTFGHGVAHSNHGSAGSSGSSGYIYESPSAIAFSHGNGGLSSSLSSSSNSNYYASTADSPSYALGQKGLGHYTYNAGSKPYHRHTDIFAASPFLAATSQHASGSSGDDHHHGHYQLSGESFAAPAVHYLTPNSNGAGHGSGDGDVVYTSGSHVVNTQEAVGLSGAYLPPPSNSYGAPIH